MASVFGWERYAGPTGAVIGMRTFGASSPIKDVVKRIDPEQGEMVVERLEGMR